MTDRGHVSVALCDDGVEDRSGEDPAPEDDDVRGVGPDGASVVEGVPHEHRPVVADAALIVRPLP